tara:strand:+ start:1718 stop:2011 length:294 start_codon:yes stop_codon:yes gene_type:complete
MELTKEERTNMISVLQTLIYNPAKDLIYKLRNIENTLNSQTYKLLLYGDDYLSEENTDIRIISKLDKRWCLKSILDYHLQKTGKISREQYNTILNLH